MVQHGHRAGDFSIEAMAASSAAQRFDAVPLVDIDAAGTFKYVLIKVTESGSDRLKWAVRGYTFAEYHADVYQKAKREILSDGVECEVAGGGRIKHVSPSGDNKGELLVYGYSVAFGLADHEISVESLRTVYPDYKITFSNEGY